MKSESTVRFIGLFVFVFIFFITPLHAEEGDVRLAKSGKTFQGWGEQGLLYGCFWRDYVYP